MTTADATLTVVPTVDLSVPGTAFPKNSFVLFSASVLNGGAGVPNNVVTFSLVKPNGTVQTQTATTNAAGTATWNYRVINKGSYTLSATSTVLGKTGTSSLATFTVF